MAGGVKPSYRQEQAAATRQRIAAAARRLFAANGYRPTTMDAIAAEAGVAPRTVYTTFGAKREILSEICEQWLFESGAVGIVNQAQNTVIASLEGQLSMPVAAAQAVYRALAAPGIYQELVVESGWTADQFEDWIADALCRQLLPIRSP